MFFALSALPTMYLATQIASIGLTAIPITHFYGVIMSHGFLFGMGYGSRMAIFMGLTSPAVAATQFTAYMAISNLCVSITNYWQGTVAENFDYSVALYIDSALIIAAVVLLPFIKNRQPATG